MDYQLINKAKNIWDVTTLNLERGGEYYMCRDLESERDANILDNKLGLHHICVIFHRFEIKNYYTR